MGGALSFPPRGIIFGGGLLDVLDAMCISDIKAESAGTLTWLSEMASALLLSGKVTRFAILPKFLKLNEAEILCFLFLVGDIDGEGVGRWKALSTGLAPESRKYILRALRGVLLIGLVQVVCTDP